MNTPPSASHVPPPTLPAGPDAVSRPRWWIHLILLSAYLLVAGAVGWSRGSSHGPVLSRNVAGLLIVCAVELLVFGLVLGLACIASHASRDDLLLRWRGKFRPVPLGIGYSIALRLAVGMIVIILSMGLIATGLMTLQSLQQFSISHRPDIEAIVDVSAMRQDPVYFWLVLTLVSFAVAGLREELWRSAFLAGLRSLWPRSFGSRAGQIASAGVAAVVFGVGHLAMGPVAVLLAGLLGFGLGVIMVLHRSIWPAVIAHGMFDATSLALLPWLMEHLPQVQQALGH